MSVVKKKTAKANDTATENGNDDENDVDQSLDDNKGKKKFIEEQYQKKALLEHILLRPDTYIGSVKFCDKTPMWVYDSENDKMVNREIAYVPGLYKIFDEILVNAADNKQRNTTLIKIDINKEKNEISVYNNGKGIPVFRHKVENMYVPELIFGTLLTSSNYNDDEKKVTGGRDGYGVKLCNIFSKKFVVETSYKKLNRAFQQTWKNNMTKDGEAKVTKAKGEDYTKVTFQPDLAKFNMTQLDDDIIALMSRRAFDIAGTSEGVSVFLNGKKIPVSGFKQYAELFVKDVLSIFEYSPSILQNARIVMVLEKEPSAATGISFANFYENKDLHVLCQQKITPLGDGAVTVFVDYKHKNLTFQSPQKNRLCNANDFKNVIEKLYSLLAKSPSLNKERGATMALEKFLKQVREYWQNFEVELVNYQNKTHLIRGGDGLFNKLKEHMNSLAAMKLSPHYKQFEEDAIAWEDRLNKINALFDVWIAVQRRWVYLEGLFSDSADIATLLPTESNRFDSASTDFLAVMRKVAGTPRILEIVHMQGAQRLFERVAEMLAKIQKALGDYLERERSSFPRFYFVGDEDLLEIMGNSKGIFRIMKHLKKMFAGIMSIEYNDETKLITGMVSREGEHVELSTPIDLNKTPRVNDWLQKLESEMRKTLAKLLAKSLEHFNKFDLQKVDMESYMEWLDSYPAQIIGITADIWWSQSSEKRLGQSQRVDDVLAGVEKTLELLSDSVLRDQPSVRRKKIEMLITEFVHKRDITCELVSSNVVNTTDFQWLQVMRFYFSKDADPSKCCVVKMANAEFFYGFEYLGIQEKLVQTPLTDRCYLTMTQALHARLGGSPFGPAGTGKTESVKALGQQLGRFVLVFNCDETFDFQAVGRILVGLCQIGAWGCFDEFNRLEERMLSAVSQQIQTVQENVRAGGDSKITIVGKNLSVNLNMAIFITMNPGYSGRSNLPDNLKQLFRSLAMTQPDRNLIAEVVLFSQGFRTAEVLAKKIVPLFILCKEQLSKQYHYDFGLRALKNVLVSAGNIKRDQIQRMKEEAVSKGENVVETDIVPQLVSEDITLLKSLLQDVFPDVEYQPKKMDSLRDDIYI